MKRLQSLPSLIIHTLRATFSCSRFLGAILYLLLILWVYFHIGKALPLSSLQQEQFLGYIACNYFVLLSLPSWEQGEMQSSYASQLRTFIRKGIILGGITLLTLKFLNKVLIFSWSFFAMSWGFALLSGLLSLLMTTTLLHLCLWYNKKPGLFFWLYSKGLFLFGGLFLPLTLYPSWLQTVAHCTPFPAILADRSQLIFSLQGSSSLIHAYFGWSLLLLGILHAVKDQRTQNASSF
ncbi:MAG: hypothetical protein FJZ58_00725 [Chlamydiae bacterium]|nr:hypothetical protein [Chlamydiota bacterium]